MSNTLTSNITSEIISGNIYFVLVLAVICDQKKNIKIPLSRNISKIQNPIRRKGKIDTSSAPISFLAWYFNSYNYI